MAAPKTPDTFVVGTRKSNLALTQTQFVADLLAQRNSAQFPVRHMTTVGDRNQTTPLHLLQPYQSGQPAKSLWTDELEAALLDGRFDVLVHSCKDVPTLLRDGCEIACLLERHDPRDALVVKKGLGYKSLKELPKGAVIGTGSVRRIAQLSRAYPDLKFADMVSTVCGGRWAASGERSKPKMSWSRVRRNARRAENVWRPLAESRNREAEVSGWRARVSQSTRLPVCVEPLVAEVSQSHTRPARQREPARDHAPRPVAGYRGLGATSTTFDARTSESPANSQRGNLNTRLAKLDAEDSTFAALILAISGLDRLGAGERITCPIEFPDMMHSVGQGALAVESRSGDAATRDVLRTVGHWPTEWRVGAERGLLRVLEGGCSVPVGVETALTELTGAEAEGAQLQYAPGTFAAPTAGSPLLHFSGVLPPDVPFPAQGEQPQLVNRRAKLNLKASVTSTDGARQVVYEPGDVVVTNYQEAVAWGEECARQMRVVGAGEILDEIEAERQAREEEMLAKSRAELAARAAIDDTEGQECTRPGKENETEPPAECPHELGQRAAA